MAKVQLEEDTIDAAGMAFRGVESGRRVGWAKAFDALRRADSAERDVNVLRSDVRILSSFAARCYGMLEVTCTGPRMGELFRGDNHEMQGFFPQAPLNRGRDAMRSFLFRQEDEVNRRRAEIERLKVEIRQLNEGTYELRDKAFAAACRKEKAELMKQFEIPTEEELMWWLGRYKTSAKRVKR